MHMSCVARLGLMDGELSLFQVSLAAVFASSGTLHGLGTLMVLSAEEVQEEGLLFLLSCPSVTH